MHWRSQVVYIIIILNYGINDFVNRIKDFYHGYYVNVNVSWTAGINSVFFQKAATFIVAMQKNMKNLIFW